MHATRSPAVSSWAWLPLLAIAVLPAAASAQTEPARAWAVVPLLGFGVVRDNGQWGSAGMEAAVELEYGGTDWRWSGHGSLRGVGVGCSHACFDGGPAVAIGGSRSIGALWIGGGASAMKDFGRWRLQPYARLSLDAAPFRFDMRVELPREHGLSVYLPILVGMPISP